MTEFILEFICAILSIIGLTEIIHSIKTALLSGKNKTYSELYIYLEEDNPDLQLEAYLRGINISRISKIYALYKENENMDECQKIADKYNVVLIKN